MADSKITDLAALPGAAVADGDSFEVTDESDTSMDASGTSKQIIASELAIAMNLRDPGSLLYLHSTCK